MKLQLYLFFAVIASLFVLSCAKQTSPTGGPQDSIPPKLISSLPKNKQTNYKSRIVTLSFSEHIFVNNAREQVIITPSLGKDIKMTAKGKNITLELGETPKDSTTYTITFRESVQDITEKNSARNLNLAFSTGSFIDSIFIQGGVKDLAKEVELKNITVALYNHPDTFDIFRHKPSYFTKSDDKGKYKIENIKAGNYFIYAFDDKNKNLIADSKTEAYGFLSDTVDLHVNKKNISIPLLHLDARKLKLASARPFNTYFAIKMGKGIAQYSIEPISSGDSVVSLLTQNQTTINVYPVKTSLDSTQIKFSAMDSIGFKVDTMLYVKLLARKAQPEKFSFSIQKLSLFESDPELKTVVNFSKPISYINYDSIQFKIDSANVIYFTKENISIKTPTQIELRKKLDKKILFSVDEPSKQVAVKGIKNTPPPKQKIRLNKLIFGLGAFMSIETDSSKHSEETATLYKTDETAILSITIESPTTNSIVQLLSGNEIIKSLTETKNHTFTNLIPGQYKLRMVLDANNNTIWDLGNFFQKKEPEKVIYYKSEKGEQDISLKANWEVGPLLITTEQNVGNKKSTP